MEKSYSNPDIALGLSCYKKLRDSFSVSDWNRAEVQSLTDHIRAQRTDYQAGFENEKSTDAAESNFQQTNRRPRNVSKFLSGETFQGTFVHIR